MSKKLLFIYNPYAGKALIKNKIADIIDIFVKADYEVTVYPTQHEGDAINKIIEKDGIYDLIVCSGGDGTLDEIVTGMMHCDKKAPIGYIPAGSTNDFANSMLIPKNMIHAAKVAVHGRLFTCDIGAFQDDFFVYIAAFGIFTEVSYLTKQQTKNLLGHMAYILEGAKRLHTIRSYPMTIEYDGNVIKDEFIFGMVTNSISVGGFKNITGNHILLDDGLFEVTLVRTPNNPIELQEIITALLSKEADTNYIYSFKTDKVTIRTEEGIPWTLDGEYGGTHEEVTIENKHKAIQLVVPEKKKHESKKQLIITGMEKM